VVSSNNNNLYTLVVRQPLETFEVKFAMGFEVANQLGW